MIALILIAAVAENGVIGRSNALPWRLKTDMAHFRALTADKPVIMGRKTYVSIGKPLKGRTTIVVSRDGAFSSTGVIVAPDLARALAVGRGDALRRGADAIVIAGGGDIYAQAMPLANRLELTHVQARPEGDAVFPTLDMQLWRAVARSEHPAGPDDSAAFAFVTYERVSDAGEASRGAATP